MHQRAVVHIGVHKTGTTSIQAFLSENRDALRDAAVGFPLIGGRPNHVDLHIYAMDDAGSSFAKKRAGLMAPDRLREFRSRFPSEFERCLRDTEGCDLVILSAEGLALLRSPTELERLRTLLERHFDEIEIVVYLRRQDELAEAMYEQTIKGGECPPRVYPRRPTRLYDFRGLLEAYEGAFGREHLNVRRYGGDHSSRFDSVEDFCATVGIDLQRFVRPRRRNVKLTPEAVGYLRVFNERFPAFEDDDLSSPLRFDIIKILEGHRSPATSSVRDSEAGEAFLRRFADGNDWIARTYFDGEALFAGAPLLDAAEAPSSNARPTPAGDEAEPLATEDVLEISFLLWQAYVSAVREHRAEIRFRQGLIELGRGHLDPARVNLEAALEWNPDHDRAATHLERVRSEIDGRTGT